MCFIWFDYLSWQLLSSGSGFGARLSNANQTANLQVSPDSPSIFIQSASSEQLKLRLTKSIGSTKIKNGKDSRASLCELFEDVVYDCPDLFCWIQPQDISGIKLTSAQHSIYHFLLREPVKLLLCIYSETLQLLFFLPSSKLFVSSFNASIRFSIHLVWGNYTTNKGGWSPEWFKDNFHILCAPKEP